MDNLTATRSLCNAIANTFYPDNATIEFALFNEGIDAKAEATPKDPMIFRVAARLVIGYVENSRSENGVSTSVMSEEALKQSLSIWCGYYGLNADEVLSEWGEPIKAQSAWSEAIPCSIKTNSDNRKGRYEDGEFRQASFTILVECIPFPYNRVKLERMGENLGEYRVMNAEPLTTVGRTQIVV